MSKKEFDDFLRKEEKKKPTIDWDDQKKWWLNKLDDLYKDIQGWLKEYIDKQQLFTECSNIDIYEEALGSYTAKQMKIQIGNKIAKIIPIGTILIGTKGRVDLTGDAGRVRFILADKQATGPRIEANVFLSEEERQNYEKQKRARAKKVDWAWKITTSPPRIKYSELNQDSFLHCLMQVCNG